MIDLHTHTFFSDGELGVAELARRAEEAGWRVLRVGGLLELSDMGDDGDEWSVSVYPPREPLVWYDETGRRTPYDVAAQAGHL